MKKLDFQNDNDENVVDSSDEEQSNKMNNSVRDDKLKVEDLFGSNPFANVDANQSAPQLSARDLFKQKSDGSHQT